MSLRLFFFFLFAVCCSFTLKERTGPGVVLRCPHPALTPQETLNCFGEGLPVRGAYLRLLNAKIPLNDARATDLMRIRGIGPRLARAILDERNRLGIFRSWDEVDAIVGMGAQKLKSLKRVCRL